MGVSSRLMNQGENASAVMSTKFLPWNRPVYSFFLEGVRLPKYWAMLRSALSDALSARAWKSMSSAL